MCFCACKVEIHNRCSRTQYKSYKVQLSGKKDIVQSSTCCNSGSLGVLCAGPSRGTLSFLLLIQLNLCPLMAWSGIKRTPVLKNYTMHSVRGHVQWPCFFFKCLLKYSEVLMLKVHGTHPYVNASYTDMFKK